MALLYRKQPICQESLAVARVPRTQRSRFATVLAAQHPVHLGSARSHCACSSALCGCTPCGKAVSWLRWCLAPLWGNKGRRLPALGGRLVGRPEVTLTATDSDWGLLGPAHASGQAPRGGYFLILRDEAFQGLLKQVPNASQSDFQKLDRSCMDLTETLTGLDR